jgi:hypothetical protein
VKEKESKVIPFKPGPTPLKPPAHLNSNEAALFREVIGSVSHRQFVEADVHLLASFVQATLVARESIKELPDSIGIWDRAVKLQATLATKLRLTPLSRIDQRAAGRRAREAPVRTPPWDEEA